LTTSRVRTSWRLADRLARLSCVRSLGDIGLLVRIGIVASLVPPLIRLPLRRVRQFIEPGRAAAEPCDARYLAHLLELIDLVLAALCPLQRPTCLTRGITRYYFLRRAGADVALAFGMSQVPDLGGHCWLVYEGEPYLEARDPRPVFAEVYRISC